MPLSLADPQQTVDTIISFLRETFKQQRKKLGVIAVSGGIDSAVSLTLLVRTLGVEDVTAVLLPYGDQSMADAREITSHLQLPTENVVEINIKPAVDVFAKTLHAEKDARRLGNMQARARMIAVFDIAKKLDALVCGTENKSEHYLGYFTRFGDAASDIEPICGLYKTQVRQLAQHLHLPKVFLQKPPSAGLWAGQTDEDEMGFTYEIADQILEQIIDEKKDPHKIEGIDAAVVKKVVQQIAAMKFKLEVPYTP